MSKPKGRKADPATWGKTEAKKNKKKLKRVRKQKNASKKQNR